MAVTGRSYGAGGFVRNDYYKQVAPLGLVGSSDRSGILVARCVSAVVFFALPFATFQRVLGLLE
jgi:hypothetical protein